eukprot:m51a1_g2912 hypothetical protein (340) ;mRNA; r:506775-507947
MTMTTSPAWWSDAGVLSHVLGALDPATLSSAASVCRHWNSVISSEGVWRSLLERDFAGFLDSSPRPYPPPLPTRGDMYAEQSAIAAFYGRSLSASDLAPVFERLPATRQATTPPPRRARSALDERSCRRMYRQLARLLARGGAYAGRWACVRPPPAASPRSSPVLASYEAEGPEVLCIEQCGYRLNASGGGGPAGPREAFRMVLDDALRRASGYVQLFHPAGPADPAGSSACWVRAVLRRVDDNAFALRWTTTHLTDFDGPASHPSLPYFVTRVFQRVADAQGAVCPCTPPRNALSGSASESDAADSMSWVSEHELPDDEQLELAALEADIDESEDDPI